MNMYLHIEEFFNIDSIPLYTQRHFFNPVLLLGFAEDRCDKKNVRSSVNIYRIKERTVPKESTMTSEYVLLKLAFFIYDDSYILIMPSLFMLAI